MLSAHIDVDLTRFEAKLTSAQRRDLSKAEALALNWLAYDGMRDVRAKMKVVFDRPTQRAIRGIVYDKASERNPVSAVVVGGSGRKSGLPAAAYLGPEIHGGMRRHKSFEEQLIGRGLMALNQVAVPADRTPLDRYGNMTQGFLNRVMRDLRIDYRGAGATRVLDEMFGDTVQLPPVDVNTSDTALDYADYNEGRQILEDKQAANRNVTAELARQNALTADQVALEREMASIRKEYEEAGGAPTTEMVRAQAEARIDARNRRREALKASRGGGGGAASTDREREAVEKLIQALQDELQMSEMTAEEKKVFENLRRAGAAATDEERASIEELTRAIEGQKNKQEQAADTADFFRDAASDSFMALIPAIETGNAALDTLINKLIEATAQAALFGDGPLGGIFGGGLLGSFIQAHATGTNFAQGGISLVGERGPELVNLPRGSEVIPNHRIGSMMTSASGASTINSMSVGNIYVSVPEGTDPKDAAAMGRAFRKQIDAAIDARLQENSRARGMLAGGPF